MKKGFWNFVWFCTRAISIEPAWGRLYQLPAGFPALEVPESSVLVTGTADPLADTRTQNTIELPENAMTRPEGDWNLIHGELMTFANPGFDLPPIDRLEAFAPHGRCVYTRVRMQLFRFAAQLHTNGRRLYAISLKQTLRDLLRATAYSRRPFWWWSRTT